MADGSFKHFVFVIVIVNVIVFVFVFVFLCVFVIVIVMADVLLFPMMHDMSGLTWFWDDLKGLYWKSWSDDGQMGKLTNKRADRISIFGLEWKCKSCLIYTYWSILVSHDGENNRTNATINQTMQLKLSENVTIYIHGLRSPLQMNTGLHAPTQLHIRAVQTNPSSMSKLFKWRVLLTCKSKTIDIMA